MSSIIHLCRMHKRVAQATAQGMRAPANTAKRQTDGNNPAVGCDPMEVPG